MLIKYAHIFLYKEIFFTNLESKSKLQFEFKLNRLLDVIPNKEKI